jgi:hypothetical protein
LCARKSPATPRMFFDFAGSESVVSRQKKISGSADHFLSIRRQTWLTLHQSFFCLPTNFICSTRTISTCLSNSYMAAQWCGFQSMNKSQRFASPSTRCPQKLRLGYHWASLFQPLCGFAFTGRVGIHICQLTPITNKTQSNHQTYCMLVRSDAALLPSQRAPMAVRFAAKPFAVITGLQTSL